MDHLALQVGEIDHVEIHQADAADAGRREIQAERRAQAAGADQQHFGGLQLQLAFHADFGHDQVPAVAQDLVFRKLGGCRLGRRSHATRRRCEGTMRDGVAVLHRRGILLQIADVFVVQVDVHEAAQLAFIVEKLLAQIGVAGW